MNQKFSVAIVYVGLLVIVPLIALLWGANERLSVEQARSDKTDNYLVGRTDGYKRYAKTNKTELETIRKAQEALLRVQDPGNQGRWNDHDGARLGMQRGVASRSD